MSKQTLDFPAIFDRFIKANQKKWAHDRAKTAGASEVFGCMREVWFKKLGEQFGYTSDETVEKWGAMFRGDLIENHFVVPAVRKHLPHGLGVLYTGDEQDTLVLGRASATPDGLITGLDPSKPLIVKGITTTVTIDLKGSTCIALEVKSIDPRAQLFEERTKHHCQTQMQLGLFRELTEHKPLFSIVLYVDASFLDNLNPFVVEFNPAIYEEGKIRADEIFSATDPMMIVPEGKMDGGCDYCKWTKACGEATFSAIKGMNEKPVVDDTWEEFDPFVTDYFKKKDAVTAAEKAFKQAGERIKERLLDKNARKVRAEPWSITWSTVQGKTSYDFDAMKADGIDLSKYESRGNGYDRLMITPKAKTKE